MNPKKYITMLLTLMAFQACYSQSDSLSANKNLSSCALGTNRASSDASKGRYTLLSYGLAFYDDWDFQSYYEKYVLKTYGIKIGNGGCVISDETECYAKKMREIIYSKFGADIFDRARFDAQRKYNDDIQTKIDTGFIFNSVDTMPSFYDGNDSLLAYLRAKLNHVKDTSGKVVAMIIVEKNGNISNVTIEKSLSEIADLEVNRVLNEMPDWKAGIHYGQNVRVRLVLPINFATKKTKPNKK